MAITIVESATPYCTALIALEYYDGPTAGVGWLQSGSTIYFKLIGWDAEQWQRLFATIAIDSSLAASLRATLSEYEHQRLPIWIPNARNDRPEATSIVNTFQQHIGKILGDAFEISLVESHDLTSATSRVGHLSRQDSMLALSYIKENRVLTLHAGRMIEGFVKATSAT